MLCILLWALCVYKEYRSVWLALEAIWQIPRSWSTDFRHNRFYSISKGENGRPGEERSRFEGRTVREGADFVVSDDQHDVETRSS